MTDKRILFIYRIFQNEFKYDGIFEKMKGQMTAIQNAGYLVDHITLSEDGLYLNDIKQKTRNLSTKLLRYTYYLSAFFRDLEKVVDSHRYKAIYIRHFLANKRFLHFLKNVKKGNPTVKLVIELPTYPYELEYQSTVEKAAITVDRYYRNKLHPFIDRIVHLGSETEIWEIPSIQIQNGISFPAHIKRTDFSSSPFTLIAIGNLAFWWGLDLLIEGIARYETNQSGCEIRLRIVGTGKEEKRLKEKVQKLALNDQVTFYGYKKGRELEDLLITSHAGIGTLSLEKKNLKKTSSLKHRLYASYGLPFVYRGIDEDFEAVEWAMKLKPVDELALEEIITWFNELKPMQKRFHEIREFARQKLSWDTAFFPFIQYLYEDSIEL